MKEERGIKGKEQTRKKKWEGRREERKNKKDRGEMNWKEEKEVEDEEAYENRRRNYSYEYLC